MLDKDRLAAIADLISEHISIRGVEEYCAKTGITGDDFAPLSPQNFDGEIFAVDGSNVFVCDWSVANLNLIRAGYAVYKGRDWQRTVITYDDVFMADRKSYAQQFESYLEGIFYIHDFILKNEELDRLSTYFRELQEYIALKEAIDEARPADLVLYDGGFTWKERPLGKVLENIFLAAEEKDVDLLGISKSSSLSWGEEIQKPLMQHTSYAGSMLAPGLPWYVRLKGKNVDSGPDGWDGEIYVARFDGRSDLAFRVDAPHYLADRVGSALEKLAAYSCSSECMGYPHALFRAHRDIRITEQEGDFLRLQLLDLLGQKGSRESQVRGAMLDYHDVIEMRPRRGL
jgi:hypothetical protein